MNSWGNDKLARRMDELLTSSVSRGSEPAGFAVKIMPRRPKFPWAKIVFILAAAVVAAFFALEWLNAQSLETTDFKSLLSPKTLTELFSGISSGKAVSLAAVVIGLLGAVVSFVPERHRVLRRML